MPLTITLHIPQKLRWWAEKRLQRIHEIVMLSVPFALVGGLISSRVLTLAVIPAIYALIKQWRLKRGLAS